MAGLIPAISLTDALYPPKRDRRDKPGDDKWNGPGVREPYSPPHVTMRPVSHLQYAEKLAAAPANPGVYQYLYRERVT